MLTPEKIGPLIFVSVFMLVGLAMVVWPVRQIWFFWRCSNWPTAPGVITASEIEEDSDNPNKCMLRILYRFKVGASEFTGGMMRFGFPVDDRRVSRAEVEKSAGRFQVGAGVAVVYNPENPGVCVLDAKINPTVYGVLGLGLAFVGGGLSALNLSGRGDRDVMQVATKIGLQMPD